MEEKKTIVSNFLHQSGKSIEIFFDNMNYELTDTKKMFCNWHGSSVK